MIGQNVKKNIHACFSSDVPEVGIAGNFHGNKLADGELVQMMAYNHSGESRLFKREQQGEQTCPKPPAVLVGKIGIDRSVSGYLEPFWKLSNHQRLLLRLINMRITSGDITKCIVIS